MDGGARKAALHGVTEGRTRLSDFTFTFHFHELEKEMATHSSVLAWRIPGKGEPGGLPSMGSQSWTRLKRLSSSNHIQGCKNSLKLSFWGSDLHGDYLAGRFKCLNTGGRSPSGSSRSLEPQAEVVGVDPRGQGAGS